jgi:hypothetical protein
MVQLSLTEASVDEALKTKHLSASFGSDPLSPDRGASETRRGRP